MPSLKEFRLRIATVKSTQKITKALQMVATAKLKRAQEAAQAARPYASRMAAVIANLAAGASGPGAPKLIAGTGSDEVHLLVVLTSERGLCGGFNANIVKLARAEIRRLREAGKTVKILTIGKKGADALKRQYGPMIVGHIDRKSERKVTSESASNIARVDDAGFVAGVAPGTTTVKARSGQASATIAVTVLPNAVSCCPRAMWPKAISFSGSPLRACIPMAIRWCARSSKSPVSAGKRSRRSNRQSPWPKRC